jgi:intracellular septation protein A
VVFQDEIFVKIKPTIINIGLGGAMIIGLRAVAG